MEESIYIALGTNLDDRFINASSIYVTPPWGYEDQPDFYNQVLEVQTALEPFPLLGYLKTIERQMGRQKTFRYGPRLIDLDILFYGERVINTKKLQIPHPSPPAGSRLCACAFERNCTGLHPPSPG